MRRRHAFGLAAVAALVSGGAVWATIPDSSGVIHACYKTSNGALRVIDTGLGGTCAASETALQWNQTGPPGPAGPAGATHVVVRTFTQTIVSDGTATFTALCHSGEVATGGGYRLHDGARIPPWPVQISESEPNSGPLDPVDGDTTNGWRVVANNADTASHDVTAYAVCASP
jgi:hypothetical protein